MFKWIKDLIGSNDGQGRTPDCCKKGLQNEEARNHYTYCCTMPDDVTATSLPPTNPPLEEKSEKPFTVKMYLSVGGDPITVENVFNWTFNENAGKVSIQIGFAEPGEGQQYFFMHDQLSYVTAI